MTEFSKNTQHQKLKAEWTKSSANEHSEKVADDGEKIKIIEQIVLFPSKPEVNKVRARTKEDEIKAKKCQICEKSFGADYGEHIKSKHEPFECPERDCGKQFQRKSSLRKHSYSHAGKFKYQCEDCDETFIDKAKFQIHCASRHKKIERTYECKECGKSFTSPDYLKKHQVTHKDEYKYTCTMCDQKFKWLTSLQTHLLIHTQNKAAVQCEGCSKRFYNQRTLERHMRIHQSQKFQCKICQAVTSIRKDNIMRHIRHLHTEIARADIPNFISSLVQTSKETPKATSEAIHKVDIDDVDDDTNDLIIDESATQEEQEVFEVPVVNNRVNVIQCIGNPHKHQQVTQPQIQNKPAPLVTEEVTEIIDLSEKTNTETETERQQPSKCDNEIQLPPKKKAIAKYDPIEHYRRILGLSDHKNPPIPKAQSDEPTFPDHWRKRTSQNFLFRR